MKGTLLSACIGLICAIRYTNAFASYKGSLSSTHAFVHKTKLQVYVGSIRLSSLLRAVDDDNTASTESTSESAAEEVVPKMTLEEKIQSWEATEEELKAASLGGLYVGKEKKDGFDLGLAIAFPIMIGTSALFLAFPFLKDTIDFTSVGPPPMV